MSAVSPGTWGALLGLVFAAGLLLVGSWLRARRPMTVLARIGPFVNSASGLPVSRREPVSSGTAWATLWLLVAPVIPHVPGRGPNARSVPTSPSRLAWPIGGMVIGGLFAVLLTHRSGSITGVAVLASIGALAGWLTCDRVTAVQVRRRRQRIERQLPAVADLLAFAVSAGESPLAALERVATTTSGELSGEIREAIADVRSGAALDVALASMGSRVASTPLQRFIDGLLIALERGTPIAHVLRAQASDARADELRQLLELAGRKDVLMLVPVVFLILPTVVLVALYPGLQSLRMVVT